MNLIKLWNRVVAHLCWLEIDSLKSQRRHTAKIILSLEAQLTHEYAHLKGIDEAIRLTGRDATKCAMRAQL